MFFKKLASEEIVDKYHLECYNAGMNKEQMRRHGRSFLIAVAVVLLFCACASSPIPPPPEGLTACPIERVEGIDMDELNGESWIYTRAVDDLMVMFRNLPVILTMRLKDGRTIRIFSQFDENSVLFLPNLPRIEGKIDMQADMARVPKK